MSAPESQFYRIELPWSSFHPNGHWRSQNFSVPGTARKKANGPFVSVALPSYCHP